MTIGFHPMTQLLNQLTIIPIHWWFDVWCSSLFGPVLITVVIYLCCPCPRVLYILTDLVGPLVFL